MVHEPSRRAHDDVHAALQFGELPLIGGAAVDRHGPHRLREGGELANLVGDLGGQFPGRSQDEHLGRRFVRLDPLDRRDAERGRLSRTGLGLADHVVAGEDQRNRCRLDRRHACEPETLHRLEHRRRQAKRCELTGTPGGGTLGRCNTAGGDTAGGMMTGIGSRRATRGHGATPCSFRGASSATHQDTGSITSPVTLRTIAGNATLVMEAGHDGVPFSGQERTHVVKPYSPAGFSSIPWPTS